MFRSQETRLAVQSPGGQMPKSTFCFDNYKPALLSNLISSWVLKYRTEDCEMFVTGRVEKFAIGFATTFRLGETNRWSCRSQFRKFRVYRALLAASNGRDTLEWPILLLSTSSEISRPRIKFGQMHLASNVLQFENTHESKPTFEDQIAYRFSIIRRAPAIKNYVSYSPWCKFNRWSK